MSIREIVRHDLLVLGRSNLWWGMFVALLVPTTVAFSWAAAEAQSSATTRGLFASTFVVLLVVPITVLVAGAFAVAKERESGTARFLLGYPNDRSEMVLGKALSRAALVDAALLVGFAGAALAALIVTDAPRLGVIAGFAPLTMLFATSYVGLAVGVSATTSSQLRAVVGAAAAYLFWSVVWLPGFPYSASRFTVETLESLLGGRLPPSSVVLVEIVNPPTAYTQSLQLLGPTFENLARSSSSAGALAPPLVAVGALFAWTVVPLAIGHLAFRRADLG